MESKQTKAKIDWKLPGVEVYTCVKVSVSNIGLVAGTLIAVTLIIMASKFFIGE